MVIHIEFAIIILCIVSIIIIYCNGPAGNWVTALKAILKSVYGHFSYDIDSYIASKLESQSNSNKFDDLAPVRGQRVSSSVECQGSDIEEEACSEHDESDFDKSEEVFHKPVIVSKEMDMSSVKNAVVSSMAPVASMYHNKVTPQKPLNNKIISSFTVENILMGKQTSSSSSTSSSYSPTSANSATSLPSPITSASSPMSSSVVGVNWVSHPPVKYTKFTILSPTAMSDEVQKRKKSNDMNQGGKVEGTHKTHLATSPDKDMPHQIHSSMPSPASKGLYTRQSSSEYKPTATSALQVYSLSSLTTSSASPTSNPPTSSARLCTLPVVTTLQTGSSNPDGKVVLSKSFPPSQQYVLLVPSSSAAISSGVQSSPNDSLGVKTSLSSASVGSTLNRSGLKTVSFQSPAASTSNKVEPSNKSSLKTVSFHSPTANLSGGRLERGTLSNHGSNESNTFRLIAPKQKSLLTGSRREGGSGSSRIHNRTVQKPQKLRFHMTTVVTKQKRMPVKSSMTVESPSAMVGDRRNVSTIVPTNHNHRRSDSEFPVESTITRSPNVYLSSPLKVVEGKQPDTPSSTAKVENVVTPYQKAVPKKLHVQNGVQSSKIGSEEPRVRSEDRRHTLEKTLSVGQQSRDSAITRHRGRTTRSYTRRKRELTFHLYEDPGTAFRAKRACKE